MVTRASRQRQDASAGRGGTGAATRELGILHVDMDSFFASVEVLDDPSLAGRAVIVAGEGDRGVVASCSYEARAFGVHSAMPSVQARRLCPDAVFRTGRFERYAQLSRQIRAIFLAYTPLVEPVGLDEAYLDVRGARRLFGKPEQIAHGIRARIASEVGLASSVGVGRTKLMAKLASRAAKPHIADGCVVDGPGVTVVHPQDELAFLHPLPVRALGGVGPATASRLAHLGVSTVGDLAAVPAGSLARLLGKAAASRLSELAAGRDSRPVRAETVVKSVGRERTLPHDVSIAEADGWDVLRSCVEEMAASVAERLRRQDIAARSVTLKLRLSDRSVQTRSQLLGCPVRTSSELTSAAVDLLAAARADLVQKIRLVGLSTARLVPAGTHRGDGAAPVPDAGVGGQRTFDDPDDQQGVAQGGAPALGAGERSAVNRAVEAVRQRFGDGALLDALSPSAERARMGTGRAGSARDARP